MKTIAIIPARGGSKGIRLKNIRLLAGRPLVAHAISSCLASRHVSQVVVSTDNHKIASAAGAWGARVIMRPAALSGDLEPSESALCHVLDQLEANGEPVPEITLMVQCTSPLTTPEDIDATIEKLENCGADVAFTVTPSHSFLWTREKDGTFSALNHDHRHRPMRQEITTQFRETGAVYAMRTVKFRQYRHRFFGKMVACIVPENRSIDIDTPLDLQVAEMLLANQEPVGRSYGPLSEAKALVMDFDGVLTDNSVWVDADGRESVRCNRSDGLALKMLKEAGYHLLVLSSEANPVVRQRCAKLNVECLIATENKLTSLKKWAAARGLDLGCIIYAGNDLNDLECLRSAGWAVAVADAHLLVRQAAQIVLDTAGGRGVLSELAQIMLESRGIQCNQKSRSVPAA